MAAPLLKYGNQAGTHLRGAEGRSFWAEDRAERDVSVDGNKRDDRQSAGVPLLLALQQLPVGGYLNVQGQFEVHQLLVLADLSGQILLDPPQGLFQLGNIKAGLFQLAIALRPGLLDFLLQGLFLAGKNKGSGGWKKDKVCSCWPGPSETDLPQLGLQVRLQSLDEAHQIRHVPF